MNNWEMLIIPLIVLGVWILATIFKTVEERMEKQQPQERPVDRPRAPSRPQSELDRFLEEARRRRARLEQGKVDDEPRAEMPVVIASPPPPATPPAPSMPPPRKREERPQKPLIVVPEARSRRKDEKPALVVPPPRPAVPEKISFTVPVNMEVPIAPGLPPPTMATPATPGDGVLRKESPMLTLLNTMLRDRQSLAAAFILREILDRPLSMRRGEARSSRQG